MFSFSQVTNQLTSSTLNNPCSTETFNSIHYSATDIKNFIYYPFWNCKVMGSMILSTPPPLIPPPLFCVGIINVWFLTCFYDQISIVLLCISCLCCNFLSKIILNENIQASVFYKAFSKMHFISARKLSVWSCHFEVSETFEIYKLP